MKFRRSNKREPFLHIHNHSGEENILFAFWLNVIFTFIALLGGMLSNSDAVLAGAIHNLGCTISIGLAWFFQHLSTRKPSLRFTFGYKRFAILGAFINAAVLITGSCIIIIESVKHILEYSNHEAVAKGMFLIAIAGILFKGAAFYRTSSGSGVNEHMISLHLLSDMLGWVAVFIVGGIMLLFNIPILDPILSVIIAVYIFYNVIRSLYTAFLIILEGVPSSISVDEIKARIMKIENILEISRIRIWSFDNESHAAALGIILGKESNVCITEAKKQISFYLKSLGFSEIFIEIE